METATLEKNFSRMGARVKVGPPNRRTRTDFSIDIRRDEKGEFFDIQVAKEIEMMVLDVQKKDRHLLLRVNDPDNPQAKFLCGHDERSWFTCAVPESTPVSSVFSAKQALKPTELKDIERNGGLKRKNAHKRHRKLKNGVKIHRQGEFMFIQEPRFNPSGKFPHVIHKNEPMSRGGKSKPHMVEYLYRTGGETVYVSDYSEEAKFGLSKEDYDKVRKRDPDAARVAWQTRHFVSSVYVKGKITHSDHKTLNLKDGWYKVLMNTEGSSKARSSVRFLD
jgi:hypothetical protein